MKYKTSLEFHRLLFAFWIFSISDICFSNLLVYSCQKILTIFVLFYCMDSRFYQIFCKTMVLCLKKIEIFEIWNFIKIPSFTIFLAFLISFFFYFTYPNLSKNDRIFYCILLERLKILSTNSRNFEKFF